MLLVQLVYYHLLKYVLFPFTQSLILRLHLYDYFSSMFKPYGHHQANINILYCWNYSTFIKTSLLISPCNGSIGSGVTLFLYAKSMKTLKSLC